MEAQVINASIAGTSHGAYILGRTVKEWMYLDRLAHSGRRTVGKVGFIYFTTAGELILDDEMYFVNEHGVWLVE